MDSIKKSIQESTKDFIQLKLYEAAVENPELKELTFFKQFISADDGSEYLLQFVHLKGPKIKLPQLKVETKS